MKRRHKNLILPFAAIYILLWISTAIFGELHINARFEDEFSQGTKATFAEQLKRYPMEKTRRIYSYDESTDHPELPWKYRSKSNAIAPFILMDKCAYQIGGLNGWSGLRLHLWFFGITHWWDIKTYWAS